MPKLFLDHDNDEAQLSNQILDEHWTRVRKGFGNAKMIKFNKMNQTATHNLLFAAYL